MEIREEEVWLPVTGYIGIYDVSRKAAVKFHVTRGAIVGIDSGNSWNWLE